MIRSLFYLLVGIHHLIKEQCPGDVCPLINMQSATNVIGCEVGNYDRVEPNAHSLITQLTPGVTKFWPKILPDLSFAFLHFVDNFLYKYSCHLNPGSKQIKCIKTRSGTEMFQMTTSFSDQMMICAWQLISQAVAVV